MDKLDVAALEDELRILARQADGFENPKALSARLNQLLTLSCIEEAARPNENSPAARVNALQQVLIAVIGGIEHDDTRLAATTYFFLNGDKGLAQSTLRERRAAIELASGIREESYRFGPEQRMRSIVAGELLRFEVEARNGTPLPPQGDDDPFPSNPPALRTIVSSLRPQYRDGEDLSPLGSLVLPDRPVYYDVMVEMSFADSPSSDEDYFYESSLTFTAELDEYVMGIVDKPGLCDVLLGECQRITDIYSCSDRVGREQRAKALANSTDTVSLTERTAAGKTRLRPIRLVAVKRKDCSQYLDHLTEAHRDDVSLFSGSLPDTSLPLPRLTVRQPLQLDKADHFCYWVADRPMYVRRIDIDLSGFTPPTSRRKGLVTVQPFMMAGASQGVLADTPHISLAIENWLVRGQGIVVIW